MSYAEALRMLAQAELAVDAARRAVKGEIGKLSIGFLGSAICLSFRADAQVEGDIPRFELMLQEFTTVSAGRRIRRGLIEIGFTRMLNRTGLFHRVLFDGSLARVIKQLFPAS